MITTGTFAARLIKCAPCFTRAGKRQVEVLFEITEGDKKGERIGDFWGGEGKARAYTADALRNCGWDGSKNLMPSAGTKIVPLNVYEHEYNGNKSLRTRVNRPRTDLISRPEDRMPADQAADFLSDLAGPAKDVQPEAYGREPGLDDDLQY